MTVERVGLVWSTAFFAGALAQVLAWRIRLPAVVLLLAMGLALGRSGLGWLDPQLFGAGLEPLVGLLVSLVLFDGGLNLRLVGRELQRSVLQLVLVRAVLSIPVAAALAHHWAGLSWPLAFVYGAIVLATGPTVVTPLLRQMRLEPFTARVLEAEGLILEPLSAVAALLLLDGAVGDLPGGWDLARAFLLHSGGGALCGAVMGVGLTAALRRLPKDGTLSLPLSLGALFLLFSLCDWLLPEAGLPAAVCLGVVVGLGLDQEAATLQASIGSLAQLAITVLFPLLAAGVAQSDLIPLGVGGLLAVGALMAFRGLVLQVAGLGLPALDWRQKLLVSWVAPRGIVTAAVASLFALELQQQGIAGGQALKGLVFLTILLTVGLQGLTAPSLARLLGLSMAEEADTEIGASPSAGVREPVDNPRSAA